MSPEKPRRVDWNSWGHIAYAMLLLASIFYLVTRWGGQHPFPAP